MCFVLPVPNSVLEELLDKSQEKKTGVSLQHECFVVPRLKLEVRLCCCSQMQHKQVQEWVEFNFHFFFFFFKGK